MFSAGTLPYVPAVLVTISTVMLEFPFPGGVNSWPLLYFVSVAKEEADQQIRHSLRFPSPLKSLTLVFGSLPALGQGSALDGSGVLSTLGSRRRKVSICTQLYPARGSGRQLSAACSSSSGSALPPLCSSPHFTQPSAFCSLPLSARDARGAQ